LAVCDTDGEPAVEVEAAPIAAGDADAVIERPFPEYRTGVPSS
jgi:hypothetical protein